MRDQVKEGAFPEMFTLLTAYLCPWTYSKCEKAPWNNFQVELLHRKLLFDKNPSQYHLNAHTLS